MLAASSADRNTAPAAKAAQMFVLATVSSASRSIIQITAQTSASKASCSAENHVGRLASRSTWNSRQRSTPQ